MKNKKKLLIYIIYVKCNYIWAIVSYFSNLIFCKKNDAKIIFLIIFYVFSLLLLFLYQSNFTKERKVYEHFIIIYVYTCLYIYLYIFIWKIYFRVQQLIDRNIYNMPEKIKRDLIEKEI